MLKRFSQGAAYSKGTMSTKEPGNGALIKWNDLPGYYKPESTLVSSIQSYIANDIASQTFTHVSVTRETGIESNKLDSPIYDVLNTNPNGEKSNFDFWTRAIKKMLTTGWAYITPVYSDDDDIFENISHSTNDLKSLRLEDAEPDDLTNTIVLKSPYDIGAQQQRTLNKLFEVMGKNFSADDIKGLLKVNGVVNGDTESFNKTMTATLDNLYKYAEQYKIGVLDLKTDYTELNNDYRHITTEEVDLIKNEVYAVYGFNPKILSGTYTPQELKAYKMAVIEPINRQLITELNRVLLSNYLRVVTSTKATYERIGVYSDPYQYLTGTEIAQIIGQMTNAGIARRNELRKIGGLRPTENGDDIVTNMNNVRIPDVPTGQDDQKSNTV